MLEQVLLTDSWGPTMRQRAVDAFGFDFAEVAKRSQLTFEGYRSKFVDFFVVSCFVHCRKPETEIYRMALDIAQVDPGEVAYIDDQELFVEVAQSLGMRGIHHTAYDSTRTALATLGLSLT